MTIRVEEGGWRMEDGEDRARGRRDRLGTRQAGSDGEVKRRDAMNAEKKTSSQAARTFRPLLVAVSPFPGCPAFPSLSRISDFGFPSDFGLRVSAFAALRFSCCLAPAQVVP